MVSTCVTTSRSLAAPVALERDVGGGLEPRPEAAAGLAHPLGDGPDLAVPLGRGR